MLISYQPAQISEQRRVERMEAQAMRKSISIGKDFNIGI